MTRADREDAVERLNVLKQLMGYDEDSELVKATQKSLDMAIKALEQEPCNTDTCKVVKAYMHKWDKPNNPNAINRPGCLIV